MRQAGLQKQSGWSEEETILGTRTSLKSGVVLKRLNSYIMYSRLPVNRLKVTISRVLFFLCQMKCTCLCIHSFSWRIFYVWIKLKNRSDIEYAYVWNKKFFFFLTFSVWDKTGYMGRMCVSMQNACPGTSVEIYCAVTDAFASVTEK
jgi:hypothetical protein